MKKFLKNVIDSLDWSIPSDRQFLGANLNILDLRTISTADFQEPVELESDIYTDISDIPVEDQKSHGTCVGQAEGTIIEFFELQEHGRLTGVSRRSIYNFTKEIDGYLGQGTYPAVAGKVLTEIGAATKDFLPDDNDLDYAVYLNITDRDKLIEDAHPRKVKGFVSVPNNVYAMRQALQINKLMSVSLQVGDWNSKYVLPTKKDGSNRGWHRVVVFRIRTLKNGDFEFHFRNSWGKRWGKDRNGDGKFLYSDYKNLIRDQQVYTDIPNELLKKAKETPYTFTRDLEDGMQGIDVKKLQDFLKEKGFFTYPTSTGYYGDFTTKAVEKYQISKGIVFSGTPKTTGFGRFGKKTRAAVNGDLGVKDPATGELRPLARRLADNLIELCGLAGMTIFITDGFRSKEEQDRLYAIGRTIDLDKKIVTNAKGGYSHHNYGIAFDVAFLVDGKLSYDGDWEKVGRMGEILGMTWGGRWKGLVDRPHFEITMGYSIEDFINDRIDWSKFN